VTAEPIRVLLVDDEPMFLEAVRALLEFDGRAQVVAAAASGSEALAFSARERPDVVLVDLAMPGMDGYEITRRLTAGKPSPQVIAVSGLSQADAEPLALAAGASAFLLKGALHDEIAEAIVAAAAADRLHSKPH
jgi:DNA-binding NarL/FixJ family response regulator